MDLPAMSVNDADVLSSDDDLNDFNALKSKTTNKQAKRGGATVTAGSVF